MIHICTALLLLSVSCTDAGETEKLERLFVKACGDQLRVLDKDVAEHGGEHGGRRYLLLRLEPSRVGTYSVVHECENEIGLYPRSRRTYEFEVAPAGTTRAHRWSLIHGGGTHPAACLGDRVIVALDISPRYSHHRFSVGLSEAEPEEEVRVDSLVRQQLPDLEVVSSAEDHLQFTGATREATVSAAGAHHPYVRAAFTARSPGRFDLVLSLVGRAAEPKSPEGLDPAGAMMMGPPGRARIPVIVVGADTRLDVVIWTAMTADYSPNAGGSYGSWKIGSDAAVLRVGDVLQTQLYGEGKRLICDRQPFRAGGTFIHKRIKWRTWRALREEEPAVGPSAKTKRALQSLNSEEHGFYQFKVGFRGSPAHEYSEVYLSTIPLHFRLQEEDLYVQITRQQARKLLDHLAKTGLFERAVRGPPGRNTPRLWFVVVGRCQGDHYATDIGWGPKAVKRIEGVRALFGADTEAARALGELLSQLEPTRRLRENEKKCGPVDPVETGSPHR